jgi:phytol kinase
MSFVLAFHALGYYTVDVPSTAAAVALISLAATVIESLPINQSVDDNLSVPGVAALFSHFMLRVGVGLPVV